MWGNRVGGDLGPPFSAGWNQTPMSQVVSLTPLAQSLNASVIDHRRLCAIVETLTAALSCDVTVWIPVFDAAGSFAAIYAAAASCLPKGGWVLWTPDKGSPPLEAYMKGDICSDADDAQQHVPIYGCDGEVQVVVTIGRSADAEERGALSGSTVGEFAPAPLLYRAVGRSGLLELAPDFQHSPAILRALVASQSEANARKVWQPDEAVTACFACGKGFHLIRRRHHCRSCLRVVCGDCSHIHFHSAPSALRSGPITDTPAPGLAAAPVRRAVEPFGEGLGERIGEGWQAVQSLADAVLRGGAGGVRKCVQCAPITNGGMPPLLAPPFATSGGSPSSRYSPLRMLSPLAAPSEADAEAVAAAVEQAGIAWNLKEGWGQGESLDARLGSPEYEEFTQEDHEETSSSAGVSPIATRGMSSPAVGRGMPGSTSRRRSSSTWAEAWARARGMPADVPSNLVTLATLTALHGTAWEADEPDEGDKADEAPRSVVASPACQGQQLSRAMETETSVTSPPASPQEKPGPRGVHERARAFADTAEDGLAYSSALDAKSRQEPPRPPQLVKKPDMKGVRGDGEWAKELVINWSDVRGDTGRRRSVAQVAAALDQTIDSGANSTSRLGNEKEEEEDSAYVPFEGVPSKASSKSVWHDVGLPPTPTIPPPSIPRQSMLHGRSPLAPSSANSPHKTPLPSTLTDSIVCAGQRSDKGLKKGGWRRSIGGTPLRRDGTPTSAGVAEGPCVHPMQHALSMVVERMQSVQGSSDGSDGEWGD
jgi:hypothetical protein